MMRVRVSGRTEIPSPFSTFDTVEMSTAARAATSRIVTARRPCTAAISRGSPLELLDRHSGCCVDDIGLVGNERCSQIRRGGHPNVRGTQTHHWVVEVVQALFDDPR